VISPFVAGSSPYRGHPDLSADRKKGGKADDISTVGAVLLLLNERSMFLVERVNISARRLVLNLPTFF